MRNFILILAVVLISCKGKDKEENKSTEKLNSERVSTSDFELIKSEKKNGLLILFPCLPCDAKNTLSELEIGEISVENGFSVLSMNFNHHLYLNLSEKKELKKQLEKIVSEYDLPNKNIFIGGFSSGGNVSLIMSDYLMESESQIQPKGVFVVDSPIDLLALYKTAQKNLDMNFSEASIQEASWIKNSFDKEFGNPENGIGNYEEYSPFILETQNIQNLKNLEKLKIRFYTEPDLEWWKKNRNNDYEDLNAYYLKKLSEKLRDEFDNKNIELIETVNQGYRADGVRHPHSWGIVNEEELIKWMKE
ncbi:hypothetical protein JM79_2162 [Gramella sp. Hel_I_59]|uniref:hypothetical protein n=1 Tax=Gramella sp. Hel_I_59 TaxID=1249978 RepID=UPI00114DAAD9|nr:hypothetical protein [Gramella sp. Hel_I_59]TQI71235.1 hypothetical protein JM79_2162 [Gramella sp. Hel_I_59]